MKCPNCGYKDPFHPSWYVPEKEVSEPIWFEEWDSNLFLLLLIFRDIIIEHFDGDYRYHITKKNTTIERWSVALDKVGFSTQETTSRKNYHLKGRLK